MIFFNCIKRYSFSKCLRASFNGDVKDFSKISLFVKEDDEGLRISSINLLIFALTLFVDNIVILSTRFLNSLHSFASYMYINCHYLYQYLVFELH